MKNLFKRTKNQIKYRNSLPSNYSGKDIFLVSFPKSGNTWLRFLLANLIKVHFKVERDVNFFTIQEFIPDIHVSKEINPEGIFGLSGLPRFIKSHSSYNPFYSRVILLVRDPRDALVSYYFYLLEREVIPENCTISDFIRSKKYGISAWKSHTSSWYLTFKQGQNIQLIYYENFVKEPEAEAKSLMELLGFYITNDEIKLALEQCSKDRMRASEEVHRSTYIINSGSKSFVRKENAARKQILSEEDRNFIESEAREIANMIGYDF